MPHTPSPFTIPEPDVQLAVDRVAASPSFRKAPVLRDLLLYLWRHRGAAVSEYAIGTEVLGRKVDFDPKTDSAVRVHISRLRTRLKEYYEAAPDSLRIQIPAGEYRLEFQPVAASEDLRGKPRWSRWAIASLLLAIGVLALAVDNYRLRSLASLPPPIDAFWEPIVRKGRSISIIVPAPLFFRWENEPVVARDFRVNRPEDAGQSAFLQKLFERYGRPEVSHLYTVASDTVAASSVSRYLEDRGVPATIVDTPAATLSLLDSQDAILFVGPGSSHQVANVMDRIGYGFDRGPGGTSRGLIDLRGGRKFPVTAHSPSRSTGHGVIALLPGKSPNTHLLVVASTFNPALASVLTNRPELGLLRRFLNERKTGTFFEAVIRYEVNSDRVLDAQPVEARSVSH